MRKGRFSCFVLLVCEVCVMWSGLLITLYVRPSFLGREGIGTRNMRKREGTGQPTTYRVHPIIWRAIVPAFNSTRPLTVLALSMAACDLTKNHS